MAHLATASPAAPVPGTQSQLAAIARARLRILVNSLRTMRGRAEMVSWIFMGLWFVMLGLGGALGLAFGSYSILSRGSVPWLAGIFWGVFSFWVFFPLIATAFTEPFDSANLLRFPLRYSSFFLANFVYGSLDASTLVGILWLFGIALGSALAAPGALPWTWLVLAMFGLANALAVRVLFAWIDRWLAQRRTREIIGILFFLMIIGFQLIGPLINRFGHHRAQLPVYLVQAVSIQRFLPAGLAAQAVWSGSHADWRLALGAFSLLLAYAALFLLLLHIRLRGQFAGENFSEAIAREKVPTARSEAAPGWILPGISSPVAAMVEKELRFLARSGPMLFTLIMPVMILVIFRAGGNPARHGGVLASRGNLAFPIGAGYALLILTNLIYNSFGADGAGVQFFFMAPVRIRQVLVAKNLAHSLVLAVEIAIVWLGASLLYGRPAFDVTAATLAAFIFGALLDFSAGNLLSLYSPKKYDYSAFGRQRAPGLTVLASFGVQALIALLAIPTVIVAGHFGSLWIATAVFGVLALASLGIYHFILGRVDAVASEKRESLIAALAKTS